MAIWKFKIDVKGPWEQAHNDEISVQQLAAVLAKKLQAVDFQDEDANYERDEFVDELEGFSDDLGADKNDFDDVLARLYDFADERRLWISTVI